MAETAKKPLPVVDFLKIPERRRALSRGPPVQGLRRGLPGRARVCSKCGTRGQIEAQSSSRTRARSTSTRSSTARSRASRCRTSRRSSTSTAAARVKGNLIGIEPDPEKIRIGMPVEVVYKDALGRKDREGNSYLTYFFQPASALAGTTRGDHHERRLRRRHRHDQVRPFPDQSGPGARRAGGAAGARRRRPQDPGHGGALLRQPRCRRTRWSASASCSRSARRAFRS